MKGRIASSVRSGGIPDLALIAIFAAPLLFLGLSDFPILLWDESRLANNAIEMHRDGLGLVTSYLGHPDLWNTKPPLLVWLMTMSISLFGPSEWAIRLPSTIAALATSGLVYWFCRSAAGSRGAGIAGALVLLTTYGFVAPHVARTGDYDALLILFATALVICCYRILDALRRGDRASSLLLACASLALMGAIMTKGVAGLMVLPGIALASLPGGALIKAVRDWRVWLALCVPVLAAATFYFVRESASPGYLEAVWANEMGGRFLTALEGHQKPAAFYAIQLLAPPSTDASNLYLASAFPWSWLALILVPLAARDARFAPVLTYLATVLVVFMLVISAAQTKISWYVAPAYPLIACLIGIAAWALLQRFARANEAPYRGRPAIVLMGLFVCLLAVAAVTVVDRNSGIALSSSSRSELRSAALLRDGQALLGSGARLRIVRKRENAPSLVNPAETEYSPQENFYATLMRIRGIDAQVVTPDYRPREGDFLAWCGSTGPHLDRFVGVPRASRGSCRLVSVVAAGASNGNR
jgi:4-amino-4-deoxy-L-arabinose transferase-like glycosyltransferase